MRALYFRALPALVALALVAAFLAEADTVVWGN